MAFSRKSRVALFTFMAFVISGCVEHLNHRDTLTLGSGNASDANAAIHEITPWPPSVNNTNVQQ